MPEVTGYNKDLTSRNYWNFIVNRSDQELNEWQLRENV